MEPWGKKTGQIAIILLVAIIVGFMFFVFPTKAIPLQDKTFTMFFLLFATIFATQFALPAYFGMRYLSRLPAKREYSGIPYQSANISMSAENDISREHSMPKVSYKDALLPFGVIGTFALLLAVPMLIIFIGGKYTGQEVMPLLFGPFFLFIFLGLIIYNNIPSSFQKKRDIVASFTGGGSIFLFHGSWPFFKLIVYKDGLEVRAMFHRFFIPYDKMDDIPDKVGFINRGILIKSDLPDVPSGIRFSGFGMKKIVAVVTETRGKHIAEKVKS